MDNLIQKGAKDIVRDFSEIIIREKTAKYKITRENKVPKVKIKLGKNNKVTIRVPYNQELIKKVKIISFASYLLVRRFYLRYIQEILEHKRSKITEICIHVSTKNLSGIKNPFDNLLAGGRTWVRIKMVIQRGVYICEQFRYEREIQKFA